MKNIGDLLALKYSLDVGGWPGALPTLVLDADIWDSPQFHGAKMLVGFPIVWRRRQTTPAKTETVYT